MPGLRARWLVLACALVVTGRGAAATLHLSLASAWQDAAGEVDVPPAPKRTGGELVLSGYFGKAWNQSSDLQLRESPGTDVTFHDVSWGDKSFNGPIYWSTR